MGQNKQTFGISAFALSLAVGALTFSARANAVSVKADPLAAQGCMSKVSVEVAEAAMKRFNLHQLNARPSEVQTLGTALVYIEKLNGGRPIERALGSESGYAFNFQNGTGNSRQETGQVHITRNGAKHNGNNVAQLVHELGHYIGNNGAYAPYGEAVGHKYCVVSSYSNDNSHEQFAEVFAAFVTRPALIKENSSAACQAAYKFFVNYFDGDASEMVNKCIEKQDAAE